MNNKACDTAFLNAIRKSAATLTPKQRGKNGDYFDGDDLAKFLRSNYPLGKSERDLLAQLVTGELQSPPRKKSIGVGVEYISKTVAYYHTCRKKGAREKVAIGKALEFLKNEFKIVKKDSTLREGIAETKKRDELVKKYSR